MATCQGEAYLHQQLESLKQQIYCKWTLYISDDGSSDKTIEIIESFKMRCMQDQSKEDLSHHAFLVHFGQVQLFEGPQKGPTENFMHLVRLLEGVEQIRSGDLVAFADQDDVWLPEKLTRAVAWHLKEREINVSLKDVPMLYAAKAYLVDKNLRPMGVTKTPQVPLVFNAALFENVLNGNTMVMNMSLIQSLRKISISNSVWHDWSAYLVATGCNGVVFYDCEPCLLYRQHDNNVIGGKLGFIKQCFRLNAVIQGRYKLWLKTNLGGLKDIQDSLSLNVCQMLLQIEGIRSEKNRWIRFLMLRQITLHRQNRLIKVLIYAGLLLRIL
jgi:glycosyltransferase involved in cell wall biosynthesis